MNSDKFYCRICFTGTWKFLRPINKQIQDYFYALTNVHVSFKKNAR